MGKRDTARTPVVSQSVVTTWPSLHPPYVPLELSILLQDQILLLHNFLTTKDCAIWQRFAQSLDLKPSLKAKKGEAQRSNDRLAIQDADFARRLWTETGLREVLINSGLSAFQSAKGLNGNIRIYSYQPGQAFAPHYDDSVRDSQSGTTSEWTLLLYLSGKEDGIVGGETAFYPDNGQAIVADLTRGTLLLHRHGSDCLLHEGRAVISGPPKLVLRSDVMF